MTGESCFLDPLRGVNGPSLFPRTLKATIRDSVPLISDDLVSIHRFMMSLEYRSPEELKIEANKILDGAVEIVDSDQMSFAKNLGNAVVVKVKEKLKEKRQGLSLIRKRVPFTLKTSRQPSGSLEQTLNVDQLQDPDDFFDAYEKLEYAKKEIQKQLDGKVNSVDEHKASTRLLVRRTGILGKSYTYKHRCEPVPYEKCTKTSSQEEGDKNIQSEPSKDPQYKIISPDKNFEMDSEKTELTALGKKSNVETKSLLDELLSSDIDDLVGDGALNLLLERLDIKPLDLESIGMPKFENVQRNSIASHTPSRSPFASLSLLQKRKHADLRRDPFYPQAVEGLGSEEPVSSGKDKAKMVECPGSLPDQSLDVGIHLKSTEIYVGSNGKPEYMEEEMNTDNLINNLSSTSVLQDEALDAPFMKQQFEAEQQSEVPQTSQKRRKPKTGYERLKRLHPPRNSLAESGSSFETGVRRSKRIKTRRLEYWKGERFLFERVNESLKLIGVKYFPPGKDDASIKVKPS